MKLTAPSFRFLAYSTALSIFLSGCGSSSNDDKSPNPDQGNRVPSVTINGDNSAQEASIVTLNAAASDSDGSISKYAWSITSGENVTLNNSDQVSVDLTLPDVDSDTQITISVTVTDNDGATARDEHTLTIVDNVNNQAPNVVINGVTEVDEQSELNLTATASDNDGEIVSYLWQLVGGEGVTLSDTDKAQVKVTTTDIDEDQQVVIAVMVTDDDGAVATAQHQLLVKAGAQTQVFTLKGRVNNAANSTVNLTVGDQTLTATTNSNGEFSLPVELDESYDAHLVKLSAPSNSVFFPEFNLVAQLVTLGDLKQLAGSDNVLTDDEYFAVNVSSFSTALFYMFDSKDSLTTSEHVTANYENISFEIVTLRATMIDMLLGGNSGSAFALPTGITTMEQLLTNENIVREFETRMHDVYALEASESAQAIFTTDIAKFPQIDSTKQLVFSPTIITLSVGRHLTLNPNGTGSIVLENGNSTGLTWQINELGNLKLVYNTPITLRNDLYAVDGRPEVVDEQILTSEFYNVFSRDKTKHGMMNEEFRRVDNNGNVVTEYYQQSEFGGLTDKQDVDKLMAADIPGVWVIDDVFTPSNAVYSEPAIATLMADGSATIEVPSSDFYSDTVKWQLSDGNLELISGSGDSEIRFTYYIVYKNNFGYAFVADVTNGSQQFARNGMMFKQQTNSGFNLNDVYGHYKLTYADRVSVTNELIIYQDNIARNGVDMDSHIARVDENGVLHLETYLDNETLELCRSTDGGRCRLNRQESYRLFAANDNSYHVMQTVSGFTNTGSRAYGVSTLLKLEKKETLGYDKFEYGLLQNLYLVEHLNSGSVNEYHFDQTQLGEDASAYNNALSINYANGDYEETAYYLDNGIAYFTLAGKSMQMSLEQFERDTLTICLHEAGGTCTDADKKQLDMRWGLAEIPAQ